MIKITPKTAVVTVVLAATAYAMRELFYVVRKTMIRQRVSAAMVAQSEFREFAEAHQPATEHAPLEPESVVLTPPPPKRTRKPRVPKTS